jgi:hypothetical protein
MKSPRFPNALLSALEKSKGLRIRAGTGAHRFIGIWFVVVDGRVMVRSWSIRPEGWIAATDFALLGEPIARFPRVDFFPDHL